MSVFRFINQVPALSVNIIIIIIDLDINNFAFNLLAMFEDPGFMGAFHRSEF
jgi:hypothetical protein